MQFSPVLNGIDLELQQGDFCVILGSNGSGKSTFLKLISGEIHPNKGKIFFNKEEITQIPLHQRSSFMSILTQDVSKSSIAEMSLFENLSLALYRGKNAPWTNAYKNEDVFKNIFNETQIHLEKYLHTPLLHLSGGQRQMIAMLMAYINPPPLLLLDEHCSALDPKTSHKIMELTQNLITKHNVTSLMVTHHLKDAITYGNRLIMLHKGQIALDLKGEAKQTITPQELLDLFHKFEDEILNPEGNDHAV